MYRIWILIRHLLAWPLLGELQAISNEQKEISMKLSEMIAQLGNVDAALEKAKTEIVAKIGELQDALADVDIPLEAEALLSELANKAQALDDIVPDVPDVPVV